MDFSDQRSSFYTKKSTDSFRGLTNIIQQVKEEQQKKDTSISNFNRQNTEQMEPSHKMSLKVSQGFTPIQQEQISPIQGPINKQTHHKLISKDSKSSNKNNEQLQQFATAWKTQANLNVLTIQKISSIITNYFKMLPQIKKRNEQIQILTNYNTKLIEILSLFEDRQRKLIQKLRKIQQLSSQCMAELCALKGKNFKAPQLKQQVSIFHKFSLTSLQYHKTQEPTIQEDLSYRLKFQKIFRQYLQQTKFTQQTMDNLKKQIQIAKQVSIDKEDLQQKQVILQKMMAYNKKIHNSQFQQLFDLYKLKKQIHKSLSQSENNSSMQKQQESAMDNFINNVTNLHSKLLKLDEQTLQHLLKNEKQIKKKNKKLRAYQQQNFVKLCEKTQTENNMYKQQILEYKNKIENLNGRLSQLKAEMDYRNMKVKANSNRSVMMEDSMSMMDGDGKTLSKRLLRDNVKSLQKQINALKKDKEKQQKQNQQLRYHRQQIIQKLRQQQIILNANPEDEVIFQKVLADKLIQARKQITQAHRQDSLISPNLQGVYAFGTNNNFQKIIPELNQEQFNQLQQKYKDQIQKLENRIKQLQQRIKSLQKDLNDKQVLIKEHVQTSTKQINEKITKINELVIEYEGLSAQIRTLTMNNKVLQKRQKFAEIMANNLMDIVKKYSNISTDQENYKQIYEKMFDELGYHIKNYQVDRSPQDIQQKILMNIDDRSSSRRPDPSDQSMHTSFLSSKSKKTNQQNKNYQKKPFQKKMSLKNFSNESPKQILHLHHSKQQDIKSSPNKQSRQYIISSPNKQQTNQKNILQIPRKGQKQMVHSRTLGQQVKNNIQIIKPNTDLGIIQKQEKIKNQQQWHQQKISVLVSSLVKQLDQPSNQSKRKKNEIKQQNQIINDFKDILWRDSQQVRPASNSRQLLGQNISNHLDEMPKLSKQRNSIDWKESQFQNSVQHNKKSLRNNSIQNDSNKSYSISSLIPKIRVNSPKSSRINSQFSSSNRKINQLKNIKIQSQVSLNISEQAQSKALYQAQFKTLQEHEIQQLGLSDTEYQKLINKLKKLKDDSDIIDFSSLYQRYKQAVNCLDRAQRLNNYHQRKYQNFIKQLEQKRKINPKQYSYQQQIFLLTRRVNQQSRILEQQQWQFENQFGKQIQQSRQLIKSQLKLMRSQEMPKKGKYLF